MSRIGKKPIKIPQGVTVVKTGHAIIVRGPKGELKKDLVPEIDVEIKDASVSVLPVEFTKRTPALWGLMRSLIQNMVEGVTQGYEKKLEIEGVGFKVALEGSRLTFSLGLSHPVVFEAPQGVVCKVEKNTVTVSGYDKELIGETASRIRRLKPPEPYKGKGIRYAGEVIRRKAGKKAVSTTG